MAEFVSQSSEAGVAIVSLNRPDVHNAFNEVVMAELTEAIETAGRDGGTRIVVLRSEGKSFSAGADIHWMKRMVDYSFEENVADAKILTKLLTTIRECPKPVIARVHGAAFGGGVGLVVACDLAVAVRAAKFSLSEVKLGIVPAVISPFVLEKIGMAQARRYALTAERFDGDEAKRIGLVSESVESMEEMDAWIDAQCKLLMANGPEALAVCKRVLRDVADASWKEAADLTAQRIAERRVSTEGQEGLKAFLEKRSPNWTS